MNDFKNEKGPGGALEGIPPPVNAAPSINNASHSSRRTFLQTVKYVAMGSLAFFLVHNWYCVNVRPEVQAGVDEWMANPFTPHWWDRVRPGKGHRRPILNGKPAEKLYLCVASHILVSMAVSPEYCMLTGISRCRTVPNEASAIKASRQYASKPHMAGTPGDFKTAQDFLALLQTELGAAAPDDESQPIYSAGTAESRNATLSIPTLKTPTAWIDVYYPVMNTPLNHSVEILGDDGKPVWSAPLEEVADETDEHAGKYAEAVPAFHGLSRSGDVKGKLVFANYGRQEDYKALVDKGERRRILN